jgi:Rrf2 family protein
MKINNSIEQGIYVLLILSLQKNHEAVKSVIMSQVLEVSDSYLKKILRKLVVAGLIYSSASKDGGFTLARPIHEITLLDVLLALDGHENKVQPSDMSRKIFEDEKQIISSELKIRNAFNAGYDAFYKELKKLSLSELIKKEYIDTGYFDWKSKTIIS